MSISTVRARFFVLVKQCLDSFVPILLLAAQQTPQRAAAWATRTTTDRNGALLALSRQ
ncbi:hypothetical protein [Thauera sp. SWB20]|uniref:hypothetical protein n=1 Tax=Thauera sp. SWB20 TaxID=1572758 RepID=UPI0012DFFFA3|nr:hypothetical protein [Thauera sp. SWB20]